MVDTIPDVKTEDKKYNFTDGVGQISSELNQLVSKIQFYLIICSFHNLGS